jgi:hypothetical protein
MSNKALSRLSGGQDLLKKPGSGLSEAGHGFNLANKGLRINAPSGAEA